MKLTEHFFLQEFKAPPSSQFIQNYLLICTFVLEPIRAKFGGPIVITSGYRDPKYNAAIGGVPTSQHVKGEACDFLVPNADKMKVYDFVCNEINWPGQVFVYAKKGHLHVGLPRIDLAATRKVMEVTV